jgi:hypothetical protein
MDPDAPASSKAPTPRALSASEALHERVLAFGRSALSGAATEEFEALACAIARFQAEYSAGYARLVERRGSRLDSLATIPAVPVDAFRLTRVCVHPEALDVARFRTSGTTSETPGVHAFRNLETYRELSSLWGERALFSAWSGPKTVIALATPPGTPPVSSLGYMMRTFMERFDGRALSLNPEGVPFEAESSGRWLVTSSGVDVDGLKRAVGVARKRNEALVVLATSFSLVALLEMLDGEELPAPSRTVVMQTGGFKGRTKEVPADRLRAQVARAFRISEDAVVSEYGMTELSGQLYEGTLPGAALSGPRGIYLEPPWLRVVPVHASTLEPVADGEAGIARFVDLSNVDSAVAVLTQDLVRRTQGGIELLGRRKSAPPRGCSLPYEGLISGQALTAQSNGRRAPRASQ